MKKVVNFWNRHKKLHSWLAADTALLGLYLAARHDRELMNAFADSVTTPLKAALGRLCALTNASVMEALYALAAVGATTTLSNLIIGFLQGLSGGFAIIIAQKFGAKDYKNVKKSFAI